MIDDRVRAGLAQTLSETNLPELGTFYRGKVRDSYVADKRRTIIVTDRISAFDVILGTIPFKGQILNGIAQYWFKQTQHLAPNHLIAVPDPNVSVVTECRVIPIEMVVRGYLTGSTQTAIWTAYQRGDRVYCGHRLPEGLAQHQALPQPLLTPTTKAGQGDHDTPVSADEILRRNIVTTQQWETMSTMCLSMFALGTAIAAERGLLLVDTKYELGVRDDGTLIFVDEIHTPDSSRYWYRDGYEEALRRGEAPKSLDKEFLRRHLVEQGYSGQGKPPPLGDELRCAVAHRYIEIYEQVTGQKFVPNTEPPLPRIRRNLRLS